MFNWTKRFFKNHQENCGLMFQRLVLKAYVAFSCSAYYFNSCCSFLSYIVVPMGQKFLLDDRF